MSLKTREIYVDAFGATWDVPKKIASKPAQMHCNCSVGGFWVYSSLSLEITRQHLYELLIAYYDAHYVSSPLHQKGYRERKLQEFELEVKYLKTK